MFVTQLIDGIPRTAFLHSVTAPRNGELFGIGETPREAEADLGFRIELRQQAATVSTCLMPADIAEKLRT